MSQGTPPQPPPEPNPAPPPQGQPAPPAESFQAKFQHFVDKLKPPADPATDTPEAKIQRMLYLVMAIGIVLFVIFVLCGLPFLIIF